MLHDTTSVENRIHDLQATAAELRAARAASRTSAGRPQGLRVRIGSAFVALGSALVNGASPARMSPVGR